MYLFDTFTNFLSGLGVFGRDKMTGSQYVTAIWTRDQLEAAYRSDWIARKAISIPAFDSTREWRNWQAEQDQIEKLEATEDRLQVQLKLQQGLTKARLYGGATILIGIEGDMARELDPETIKKDGLKFLHVMAPHQLHVQELIRDIANPYYGQPEFYILRSDGGANVPDKQLLGEVKVHPSRMVRLMGLEPPDPMLNSGWGDPLMQVIHDAVNASGMVMGSIATLITEAKFDVIKIPGLTEIFSTQKGTDKLIKRFSEANVAKSVVNAVVMDAEEDWQRIGVTFQGMPEILQLYLQVAAGAADIPATRFLGMSPAGLNSTGESDLQNYYDRIHADQVLRLSPALEKLDKAIQMSALGKYDEDVFYEWNPLWQMTEAEKADIAFKKAQSTSLDVNSGLIPFEALVKGKVNQLIEDGTYPGLEQAVQDAIDSMDQLPENQLPPPGTPPMLPPPSGRTPQSGMGGQVPTTTDTVEIRGSHYTRDQLVKGLGKQMGARLFDAAWNEQNHTRGDDKNKGHFGPGGSGAPQETPQQKGMKATAALAGKTAHDLVPVTPELFVTARDQSDRPQFLSAHPAEELTNHKLFTNHEGTVGISVDPKGDIQNVFNNGGPKGGAAKAMVTAIENGGNTLDCYDGYLNGYYHQFGFEEDSRMKFNADFAPEQWDFAKHNSPDIVFMSWRGYLDKEGADGALKRAASEHSTWEMPERSASYGDDWDAAKEGSRTAAADAGGKDPAQRGGKQPDKVNGGARGAKADGAGSKPRDRSGKVSRATVDASFTEELHPRNAEGEFGSAAANRAAKNARAIQALNPKHGKHELGPGYSKSAVIDAHGKIHTDNVYDAVLALHQDREVELKQPKQVSTLIKLLGEQTKHMVEAGEHVPNFDLCKVSVKGTNLFCADHKGIPRVKMPQMDDDQTKAFIKSLKREGFDVSKDTEKSAHLRATQTQLDTAKVNKFFERIKKDPEFEGDDKRLVVSKDDYVLDGHHHWAAQIAADAIDNKLGDHETRVYRVDADIITLYKRAMKFTGGKGAKGQGDSVPFDWDVLLGFGGTGYTEDADAVTWNEDSGAWEEVKHPREHGGEHGGQFTSVVTAEETTPDDVGEIGKIAMARGTGKMIEAISGGEQYRGTHIKSYTTQGVTGVFIENAQRLIKKTGKYQATKRSYRLREPFKYRTLDATGTWKEELHPRVTGGSTAGQFGSGTGPINTSEKYQAALKALAPKPAAPKVELHPVAVDVGGDEWNKALAVKLETQYQTAKPKLDGLLKKYSGEDQPEEEGVAPDDEQEYDGPPEPESWDMLSDDDHSNIEEQYYSNALEQYVDSENESWHDNGGSLDQAKGTLADDEDWITEAVDEYLNAEDDDGVTMAEQMGLKFTVPEISQALTLAYDSNGEGTGSLDVEFDDKLLHAVKADVLDDPAQAEMAGFEKKDYSELLTEKQRKMITDHMEAAFDAKAEKMAPDEEPPDFSDSAKEYMEENWNHNMDDDEKFKWAKYNTSIINDLQDEYDKAIEEFHETGATSTGTIGVPVKFDPMNKTSGTDYVKTQKIARQMSLDRAEQVFEDRGIKNDNDEPIDRLELRRMDSKLWSQWKASSTSQEGQLLQVAVAAELGGRLNLQTGRGGKVQLDPNGMMKYANREFASTGGWAGVRAYVRAKWETTQFLLDKAEMHDLELYRGISVDQDVYKQANEASVKDSGYIKAPTIKVVRNGAASTTFNPGCCQRMVERRHPHRAARARATHGGDLDPGLRHQRQERAGSCDRGHGVEELGRVDQAGATVRDREDEGSVRWPNRSHPSRKPPTGTS